MLGVPHIAWKCGAVTLSHWNGEAGKSAGDLGSDATPPHPLVKGGEGSRPVHPPDQLETRAGKPSCESGSPGGNPPAKPLLSVFLR